MRGLGQGWWWGGGSLYRRCRHDRVPCTIVGISSRQLGPCDVNTGACHARKSKSERPYLATLPSTGLRRRHAAPRRKRPLAHHSCRRLRLLHCSNAAGLPYGGLRAAIRVQIRSRRPVWGSRRQMHPTKRSGGGSPLGSSSSSSRQMGQTARGSGSGASLSSCRSLELLLAGAASPGERQRTLPEACSQPTAAAAAPPCSPLLLPPSSCCPGGRARRRGSDGSASCSCCTGSSRSC